MRVSSMIVISVINNFQNNEPLEDTFCHSMNGSSMHVISVTSKLQDQKT